MTWEEAVLILHRLAEADVRGIVWTGGGEPTRWPYLLQGLQLADQLGMDSILYTNGRLFRAADLPHLATLPRLRLIRISLSAGTPVIHAQFHGYDGSRTRHFDRVVQNIEGLACAIVQRGDGGGPQMGIGVIINEVNVDDLINTARLLRTIHERCGGGIAFLHVRPVVNYHYPDRPQIDAGVIDRAVAQRPLIESILAEAGIRLNFLDHRFEEIQQGSGLKPFDECRGAGWVAEIGPRGKVYFCCETALLPEWEIGDLTRQTLPEIWAGEARWRIIEQLRKTQCAGCPVTCLPRTLNTMMQAVENARQRGGTSRTNFLRKVRLQQDRPPCRLINFVQ
jgi:radical SAM protein with 4Fe4S-binding SPASM domain